MPDSKPPSEPQLFATERNPRLRIIIPIIVATSFFMENLDTAIIATAIPQMARSLEVTPLRLNLVITTYVLTLAIFIPISGWFADRFGSRRTFTLALLVFTVGSVLSGAAQSFEMLIATRVLQGMGGALMTPVGRLILLRSFPRSQMVTAMTYALLPAVVGPLIGPLLGGLLTTYASWRWIFFVNVPVGCLGIYLALRFVDDFRASSVKPFDFRGFLLLGSGLALLQFGMEGIGRTSASPLTIWVMIGLSALLLLGFGFHVRRAKSPVIDLTLFGVRSFWVGTLAGSLARIGMNGAPFLLPLMLQVGFGLSPIASGSLLFVSAFGAFMVRPLMPLVLRQYGFREVLWVSAILGSASVAGFSLLDVDTPHWIIMVAVFIFGTFRSAQFMTTNTLAYADLPADKLSYATSLGGIVQQLSLSFGVSTAAIVLGLLAPQDGVLHEEHFHKAFLILAILPLLAVPGYWFLKPEDGVQVSGYRKFGKS